jgi:Flp pilus assembly protein CpaB
MTVERLIMALCALMGAAGLSLFGRHVWTAGAAQQAAKTSRTCGQPVVTLVQGFLDCGMDQAR